MKKEWYLECVDIGDKDASKIHISKRLIWCYRGTPGIRDYFYSFTIKPYSGFANDLNRLQNYTLINKENFKLIIGLKHAKDFCYYGFSIYTTNKMTHKEINKWAKEAEKIKENGSAQLWVLADNKQELCDLVSGAIIIEAMRV